MKLYYTIGALVFGLIAVSLADPFFIYLTHPMRGIALLMIVFMMTLMWATSYFDLGVAAGFVLTLVFFTIWLQPFGVAQCLSDNKELSIKAAIANPDRENWETYLNSDNSLWDVDPSDLKFCRAQHDLFKQLKGVLGSIEK